MGKEMTLFIIILIKMTRNITNKKMSRIMMIIYEKGPKNTYVAFLNNRAHIAFLLKNK